MQEGKKELGGDFLNCVLCIKLQEVQSVPVFLICFYVHSEILQQLQKVHRRITNLYDVIEPRDILARYN